MKNQITVSFPSYSRRDLRYELQQLRDEYHINTSQFCRRLIQDGIDEFRLKRGVALR
tara:strand:- start:74 stop:244 length:171 start_codon:yes stop_codon:yes gene_type:complete